MSSLSSGDKYEKILIPFSAGVNSLFMLLWALQRRKKIHLIYVENLHFWSGKRERENIEKLIDLFYDYWGESISRKERLFFRKVPDDDDHGSTQKSLKIQRMRKRNEKMIREALKILETEKLDTLYLSDVIYDEFSFSSEQKKKVKCIRIPNSFVDVIENIDFIIHDENICKDIFANGVDSEDVWNYIIPCDNIYKSDNDKRGDVYDGCCSCDKCFFFIRVVENISSGKKYVIEQEAKRLKIEQK